MINFVRIKQTLLFFLLVELLKLFFLNINVILLFQTDATCRPKFLFISVIQNIQMLFINCWAFINHAVLTTLTVGREDHRWSIWHEYPCFYWESQQIHPSCILSFLCCRFIQMTEMYFNIFHKVLSLVKWWDRTDIKGGERGVIIFFVFLEGKTVIKENLSLLDSFSLFMCLFWWRWM